MNIKNKVQRVKRILTGPPRGAGVRAWRPAWVPEWLLLRREGEVHPHVEEERPGLFLASNTGSTEIEVLNWLHAWVCLLKPQAIVETGALDGLGTIAIASACRANGFGMVHSIEIDPAACANVRERVRAVGLNDFAQVHCSDSLSFLKATDLHFDLGFFDSLCQIRVSEYRLCRERGLLSGPAIFHDTSPFRTRTMQDPPAAIHDQYRADLLALAQEPNVGGWFESTLSRGVVTVFPRTGAGQAAAPAGASSVTRA